MKRLLEKLFSSPESELHEGLTYTNRNLELNLQRTGDYFQVSVNGIMCTDRNGERWFKLPTNQTLTLFWPNALPINVNMSMELDNGAEDN